MGKIRLKTFFIICVSGSLLIACSDKNRTEPPSTPTSHDHSAHEHDDKDLLSMDPNAKKPELHLSVEPDSVTGWNIHIDTRNFDFTPKKIGQKTALLPEGHAHVYVDDYKIARIYSPWYHLKELTPGPHTIRISLNANDHSNLTYNGVALDATIEIMQH